MLSAAALESALPLLALATPFAVLLVVLARLFRARARQPQRAVPTHGARVPVAPPPHAPGPSAPPVQEAPPASAPPHPESAASDEMAEGDDMFRHIGPIPDPKTPAEMHEDIKAAERAGNHGLLARLCLDVAQADPADPRTPELLRKCVRAALRSKSFAIHAAARLELAERARLAGDLTTACEHWQIARGLFFDMQDRELHKTAEGLMLRHGCPTDWVLTDF